MQTFQKNNNSNNNENFIENNFLVRNKEDTDLYWLEEIKQIKNIDRNQFPVELDINFIKHTTETSIAPLLFNNLILNDVNIIEGKLNIKSNLWEHKNINFKKKPCLIFFSPVVTEKHAQKIDNIYKNTKCKSDYYSENGFLWNSKSLYGTTSFIIKWKYALKKYAKTRKSNLNNIKFHMLGTYKYTQEWCYYTLISIE